MVCESGLDWIKRCEWWGCDVGGNDGLVLGVLLVAYVVEEKWIMAGAGDVFQRFRDCEE